MNADYGMLLTVGLILLIVGVAGLLVARRDVKQDSHHRHAA